MFLQKAFVLHNCFLKCEAKPKLCFLDEHLTLLCVNLQPLLSKGVTRATGSGQCIRTLDSSNVPSVTMPSEASGGWARDYQRVLYELCIYQLLTVLCFRKKYVPWQSNVITICLIMSFLESLFLLEPIFFGP